MTRILGGLGIRKAKHYCVSDWGCPPCTVSVKRGVRGSSTTAAGFGERLAREPRQSQQSIPALLKTDRPCFVLLLRLLEGKIRFASCSAILTESLSPTAGRKAEPAHGGCTWVLAQLRGTPRVVHSPLLAGCDTSCWCRGSASMPQRHHSPPAAIPAALPVVEKAVVLNDGRDPCDPSFAKPVSRSTMPACASLAHCRCSQLCPALVPFSSHRRMSWHTLTTHS